MFSVFSFSPNALDIARVEGPQEEEEQEAGRAVGGWEGGEGSGSERCAEGEGVVRRRRRARGGVRERPRMRCYDVEWRRLSSAAVVATMPWRAVTRGEERRGEDCRAKEAAPLRSHFSD